MLKGVTTAVSGYAGGRTKNPTYKDVMSGTTGHAEAVRVSFDPVQVSYRQLLQVFFGVAHDPTQLNRQGPDVGSQYRSAIFYGDGAQQQAAAEAIQRLDAARGGGAPIVTQVAPLRQFYPAEAYHQNYLALHPAQPYIVIHDLPKLGKLRQRFPDLYR